MKKNVLAMAFGITGSFAQDLTKREEEPFLPDEGDWLPESKPIDFTNNSSPYTNPKTPKMVKRRKGNNSKVHKRKKAKNGRNN